MESKQVLRTRKLISNSLLDLMRKKNYDEISVKDICDNAMITRATFYKYYEDKTHLTKSLIQQYKEIVFDNQLKNFSYSTPKQFYLKIAELTLDFISKNEADFLMFIKHSNSEHLSNLLLVQIKGYIEDSLKTFLSDFQFRVPVQIISRFLTGGLVYAGMYFIENRKKFSKEEILGYIEDMIDFSPFATL